MKFAVYGLGALGTVFSTFLKENGNKVYGITKREYIHLFENIPFRVTGIWGEHSALLDGIYYSLMHIDDELDYIILTVKSYDTQYAVKQIKPYMSKKTKVIVAQNGYGNYETVSQEIGKERTLLARVIFGAKLIDFGYAEVTVIADDVVIGQPERAIPENEIKELVNVFNKAGIPSRFSNDVYKILWDKILYNCALNPLGAILECTYGDLAEVEETKRVMDNIIDEIFTVTNANKIELNWENPDDFKEYFYNRLIPPTAKHYPSMYYDIKMGKRTEIDALNGAIIKLAQKKNLKVPVNETITCMVKAKEKLKT